MKRRGFLRALTGAAAAWPLGGALRPRRARAAVGGGVAKRFVVFYYPDGIAGPSQEGDASLWHAQGSGSSFGSASRCSGRSR